MKQALIFLLLLISFTASAVEVAPRISDREIIEALADIKAELKINAQRFEQMQATMDQRFEQMQTAMNQRFEQVDQRFEQSNQQFNTMHNTMLTLFATVGALIVALFGYIVWDRRTALKPLEERFNALEKDLVYDLQLRDDGGSLLTRLLHAMRGLAQEDPKVAHVLKTFSLL